MLIGVPREIKNNENRVALTPSGAARLVQAGHQVIVETDAGKGAGFSDARYSAAGCSVGTVTDAWNAELVLKIKEPQPSEYHWLRDQILFTYLHLAGVALSLTNTLLTAGTTAIAYETVRDAQGRLPLLAPMSAVAGNMAMTMGSYYLARCNQGKGVQLGTVLGETHGKVVILGDGIVGQHAARVALAMGAETVIISRHPERESTLKQALSNKLRVVLSNPEVIANEIRNTELLVGAVLHPGSKAPHLVNDAMVATMEPGSVIVDVSIDQGGCIATSRPTSHNDPVYQVHDVTHYCVTNMPGAYPRTSTVALTNATLPYIRHLADRGLAALGVDPGFTEGLNTHRGYITNGPVADALGLKDKFCAAKEAL